MDKEQIHGLFGSFRLEAISLVIMDEINLIRTELNLPERTIEQAVNAMNDKLSKLTGQD